MEIACLDTKCLIDSVRFLAGKLSFIGELSAVTSLDIDGSA